MNSLFLFGNSSSGGITGPAGVTGPQGPTGPTGPAGAPVTGNYFQGYMGASGSWSTTSTSFANLTNAGGNTLTPLYRSAGFSIAAIGNSLCGIVITPPAASSIYQITVSTSMYMQQVNTGAVIRLTDGITAFSWAGIVPGNAVSDQNVVPATLFGYYAGNTTGTISLQIQGLVQASTLNVGYPAISSVQLNQPSVVWSIMEIQ